VYVRDGLAFLSHWNPGMVILDVGHGIAGGSPVNPVEVSRIPDLQGQTHNAWYWPEAGYVFVGEEDFSTPGIMQVVDVRNLREPRVAATYSVPGQPPHNFWLDESTSCPTSWRTRPRMMRVTSSSIIRIRAIPGVSVLRPARLSDPGLEQLRARAAVSTPSLSY
jgi:hypothetical protein